MSACCDTVFNMKISTTHFIVAILAATAYRLDNCQLHARIYLAWTNTVRSKWAIVFRAAPSFFAKEDALEMIGEIIELENQD
mmetsp:Transcript_10652/g.26086  ORF Transcript_10652/g.26086 Transcript_10652/m.26086 type:complete len:82 (-) Transcript_10652:1301-1546(-)